MSTIEDDAGFLTVVELKVVSELVPTAFRVAERTVGRKTVMRYDRTRVLLPLVTIHVLRLAILGCQSARDAARDNDIGHDSEGPSRSGVPSELSLSVPIHGNTYNRFCRNIPSWNAS